jgi:hypothetical protein
MGRRLFRLIVLTICIGALLRGAPPGRANAVPPESSAPASSWPASSDSPTDAEILGCGILPQPLAAMSSKLDAAENRALVKALVQYQDLRPQRREWWPRL